MCAKLDDERRCKRVYAGVPCESLEHFKGSIVGQIWSTKVGDWHVHCRFCLDSRVWKNTLSECMGVSTRDVETDRDAQHQ